MADRSPREYGALIWTDTRKIHVDVAPLLFGRSYPFDGLDLLRWEARGRDGNYVVWPSNGRWSLYRDRDGALWLERFADERVAKSEAERLDVHANVATVPAEVLYGEQD